MRTNTGLWWILSGFFLLMAVVYTTWAIVQSPDQAWHTGLEPVGTVALLFTSIMGALIAFYVGRVHSAQGGELPEDVLTSDIDDGDPELGFFSPWSWWPMVLAAGAALAMLGLAIGFWIAFIAVPIVVVALVGWVFEYYRGNFAR